jgi:hypothetical protein
VGTLRLNDQALSAGSSVTSYTGSQSTADAALVAAFAAQSITYSDTLAGYAYSVISMPVVEFDGRLDFTALVQGRKLYDPRKDTTNGGSGAHRLATPSTWEYSDNPSLALADFLYSSTYGANTAPLWSSVITAANANDALIGSPSETHRKIGLTFTQAAPVPDLCEALRAYAGCWLVPTSGGVKLLPDATTASSATYSHASGNIAAIGALQLRDLANSPTAVEVVYTDTAQVPYREASAFAQRSGAGTTLPWRLSTVRLPGIQRYGQALREATERLNKLYLSDLDTGLEVFDGGIAHEVGDVITVTHPVGLTSKLFRVAAPPESAGPGRWRLRLAEYDPAVYSTAVATAPTYTNAGVQIGDAAWTLLGSGNLFYPAPGYVKVPDGVYGYNLRDLRSLGVDNLGLQPLEYLTLSADVWCESSSTASAGQYATLFLYAEDSAANWHYPPSVQISNAGTTRQRFSVTTQLPANTANWYRLALGLYHQGTNAGTSPVGIIYCDRVQVERGQIASAYAPRVVAGEVGTTQLATNSATEVIFSSDDYDEYTTSASFIWDRAPCSITCTNTATTAVSVELSASVTSNLSKAGGGSGYVHATTGLYVVNDGLVDGPPSDGILDVLALTSGLNKTWYFAETWVIVIQPGKTATIDLRNRMEPTGNVGNVTIKTWNASLRVTVVKR